MHKLLVGFLLFSACRCATGEIAKQSIADGIQRSVWVDTDLGDGNAGNCSGVVLETGKVLTAKHCLGVKMSVNGRPATPLAIDDKDDLLLLAVKSPDYARVAYGPAVEVGDPVYSVGTLTDLPSVYTRGYVMKLATDFLDVHVRTTVKLDAAPGISGAGVYNVRGQLVGIIVQYRTAYFNGPDQSRHWGLLCGSIVDGSEIVRFLKSTKGKA